MPLLRPPFLHQQCRRLVAATRMQCRIVANVHRVHLLPAPLLTCHHAESAGSKHMSKGQGRRAYTGGQRAVCAYVCVECERKQTRRTNMCKHAAGMAHLHRRRVV